jgi:hypothetical protein
MAAYAVCPVCEGRAVGPGTCKCGYVQVDEAGRAYTQSSQDPNHYTREPNLPVWVGDTPAASAADGGGESVDNASTGTKVRNRGAAAGGSADSDTP